MSASSNIPPSPATENVRPGEVFSGLTMPKDRPAPGTKTVNEIKVRICSECGHKMNSAGACSDTCWYDYDLPFQHPHIIAIYERVDTFLRDEPVLSWSGAPTRNEATQPKEAKP
jgi:hypothetical protein